MGHLIPGSRHLERRWVGEWVGGWAVVGTGGIRSHTRIPSSNAYRGQCPRGQGFGPSHRMDIILYVCDPSSHLTKTHVFFVYRRGFIFQFVRNINAVSVGYYVNTYKKATSLCRSSRAAWHPNAYQGG